MKFIVTFRTSFRTSEVRLQNRHPFVTVAPEQLSVPRAFTRRWPLLITWATAAEVISVVIRKKNMGKICVTVLTWLVHRLKAMKSTASPWLRMHYLLPRTLETRLLVLLTRPRLLVSPRLVLVPRAVHLAWEVLSRLPLALHLV